MPVLPDQLEDVIALLVEHWEYECYTLCLSPGMKGRSNEPTTAGTRSFIHPDLSELQPVGVQESASDPMVLLARSRHGHTGGAAALEALLLMNGLQVLKYLASPEGARLLRFLENLEGVPGQFKLADAMSLVDRVMGIAQRTGRTFTMVIEAALDDYEERLRLIGR